jgi:hypothetical protein
MRSLLIGLTVLAAAAAPVSAQKVGARSPTAIASELLAAHRAQNWRELQANSHPAALHAFKLAQIERVSRKAELALLHTVDGRDRHQQRWRISKFILDSIYRVGSVDSLRALPAESLFVRYHATMERVIRAGPAFAPASHRVLGEVIDDSTAYVVVETQWRRPGAAPTNQVNVTSFHRTASGWRSMLDGPLALDGLVYHGPWDDEK